MFCLGITDQSHCNRKFPLLSTTQLGGKYFCLVHEIDTVQCPIHLKRRKERSLVGDWDQLPVCSWSQSSSLAADGVEEYINIFNALILFQVPTLASDISWNYFLKAIYKILKLLLNVQIHSSWKYLLYQKTILALLHKNDLHRCACVCVCAHAHVYIYICVCLFYSLTLAVIWPTGTPLIPANRMRCSRHVSSSYKILCWGQIPHIDRISSISPLEEISCQL